MKTLLISVVAVLGLSGCVAVPYGGYGGGVAYAPAVPAVSFGYYGGGGYYRGGNGYYGRGGRW